MAHNSDYCAPKREFNFLKWGITTKKQKGAFTLEAVIVVVAVMMILFAIIAAFMLMYQNAVIYYVATRAAQEGAIMWTDMSHNIDGTVGSPDNQVAWYRLGELIPGVSSSVANKTSIIKNWAETQLKKMNINAFAGNGAETVSVQMRNYVIYEYVEVTITKEVNIPFAGIAKFFGENLDMKVTARASIFDAAESIRNIDYGMELAGTVWSFVKDKLGTLLKK